MQNGFIESFNGRLRDQFLNENAVHHGGAGPHRSLDKARGLQRRLARTPN